MYAGNLPLKQKSENNCAATIGQRVTHGRFAAGGILNKVTLFPGSGTTRITSTLCLISPIYFRVNLHEMIFFKIFIMFRQRVEAFFLCLATSSM
jgi:hypothetical protein